MKQELAAEFQQALLRNRWEVMSETSPREEILIEPEPDSLDQLQASAAREIAITRLNRNGQLLRSIEDALARIARKEFGICLECGAAISMKRLRAVPWAARCVKCQEGADSLNLIEPAAGLRRAA